MVIDRNKEGKLVLWPDAAEDLDEAAAALEDAGIQPRIMAKAGYIQGIRGMREYPHFEAPYEDIEARLYREGHDLGWSRWCAAQRAHA